MQEFSNAESNESTGLDLRASPNEDTIPVVERNKTVESCKESGLGGLKKKPTFSNRYLVVWVNSREGDSRVELKLELPDQCTVQDCIALSLKTLNNLLPKEDKEYTISDDCSQYFLYISKKNGMPKTDYPPFDMDQKLNETSILTYTLVNKSDSVYIFKNGVDSQKRKSVNTNNPHNSSMLTPFKDSVLKGGNPNGSLLLNPKGAKDRQVVFSNKSTEVNVFQKKETKSTCGCLCFQWLFRKNSKEVLLEGNSSNDSDNVVKNSGI